jgi:hypothetical protein
MGGEVGLDGEGRDVDRCVLAPLEGYIAPVITLHFSRNGSAVRVGGRRECHGGLILIDPFSGRR